MTNGEERKPSAFGRLFLSFVLCPLSFFHRTHSRAFTLIELLVVVAIIGILGAIALVNFAEAQERAMRAANAGNLHTIAVALQTYVVDYDDLPPADREAGPFASHTEEFTGSGNGPAAGGSWDGVPWLLYDLKYVSEWRTLFCPKYLKLYRKGETIRGEWPRYHNFRYAYNSSSMSSGGHAGGAGNIMDGDVWVVRDLYLGPRSGFYGEYYPASPADFTYPWGPDRDLEHVIFADFGVRLVVGGTDEPPDDYPSP